jgi:hypothetical protein
MSEPPEDAAGAPSERVQFGDRLSAEITDRLVALVRQHYGRGPITAKTYFVDNLIVCLLTHAGRQITVEVTADGDGLVSHAGSALLAQVADKTGLTRALAAALAEPDCGPVVTTVGA